MKYDFTSVPDRSSCGSMKWDSAPDASTEFVPLSTADMEFPTAPAIREAVKRTADSCILGYTQPTDAYYDAVTGWMKRRHGFCVDKDWILTTPGVVDALAILIDAVTKPAESVLILTPVYYPFDLAVTAKSRKIVYSELINNNGRYEIDYDDLRAKASRPEVTALLFCNPHNPVGRVWSRGELERVADICCDNGVFIIDDEIHNDIIMPGYEHTVMACLNDRVLNNIAVCTAPSKTFNLAGLQCSNIIIPNALARTRAKACSLINMQMQLNIFAYSACIAAYTECEDWLEELLKVIKGNADFVRDFMAEHFPQVRVIDLEGTYLIWLDMRGLGLTHTEMRRMLTENHLYLDNGEMFGRAGRGYQRINLACARVTLEKALNRFKAGMDSVRKAWEQNGRPVHKTLKVGDRLDDFVYSSPYGKDKRLVSGEKSTLIVFSRFYGCELCTAMLKLIKGAYPVLRAAGCEVKFIMQSDMSTLARVQPRYPFELVSDPAFKLYDRYNVFEADSPFAMILGDRIIAKIIGKDVKRIIHSSAFEGLADTLSGGDGDGDGPRRLQMPAFFTVDKNLRVTYAHYAETMADLPDIRAILKGVRGR